MDLTQASDVLREFGYPALIFFGTAAFWVAVFLWGRKHVSGLIDDHRALVQQTTLSVRTIGESSTSSTLEIRGLANEMRDLANIVRSLAQTSNQGQQAIVEHDRWAREALARVAEETREAESDQQRRMIEHDAWLRDQVRRIDDELRRMAPRA